MTFRLLALLVCGTMMLASCDDILDDDYGDCSIVYRVKFKYDYNMKYADAFANEVNSVSLYVFDEQGNFIRQYTEEGDTLATPDYVMTLTDLQAGTYHFICWAGLDNQESFSVPSAVSTYEDLTCMLNMKRTENQKAYSDTDLRRLFHGEVKSFTFTDEPATVQTVTMPLIKNTNKIRVVLQQLSDGGVDASKFDFTLTDDNGYMNYDNTLMKNEEITYMPWHQGQGTSEVNGVNEGRINVAVAQHTTSRLVVGQPMRLSITNRENGKLVLSIPLIDYLLLTEAEGHDMTAQEYLDRQDEYSLTFFVDENMAWIKTQIIINDWIVRYNDIEGLE